MLVGLKAAIISGIDQGRFSVGVDLLFKISHALGLKVDIV